MLAICTCEFEHLSSLVRCGEAQKPLAAKQRAPGKALEARGLENHFSSKRATVLCWEHEGVGKNATKPFASDGQPQRPCWAFAGGLDVTDEPQQANI